MLNPFSIEKELFVKTDAFTTILATLKGIVATSILTKKTEGCKFAAPLLDRCNEVMAIMEAANKQYVCKICGKEFDEGRKLGGHVSRAHKGSQMSIAEPNSDTETYRPHATPMEAKTPSLPRPPRPARAPRVRNYNLFVMEEEESPLEIYVPRASRRRAKPCLLPVFEFEDSGLAKRIKMEAIFEED